MAGEDDILFTTESRLRFGIPQIMTGYVLDWSGVRFPARALGTKKYLLSFRWESVKGENIWKEKA